MRPNIHECRECRTQYATTVCCQKKNQLQQLKQNRLTMTTNVGIRHLYPSHWRYM